MTAASPRALPERTMATPRPHQLEALEAITTSLSTHARTQLLMACGSGKTLVGRWLAERRAARTTLVVVPSLALVAQTLREWRSDPGWLFEALIICSDPSTAAGEQELASADGETIPAPFWARHRAQVTTSPRRAAEAMTRRHPDRPLVIFSTYHSAHVVAAAARDSHTPIDLLIADEAHRLAGHPRTEFRAVLSDDLPATVRVFMTATQVTTTATDTQPGWDDWSAPLSMDDEDLFGPVAYRLDFSAAIERDLLSDYEILIYESPGQSTPDPAAALAAAAARGLTRVLSFHGRVAKAQAFAEAVDGLVLPDGRRVLARSVSGADPAVHRSRSLDLLVDADPDTLVVISSARCLTEGVDIPAVDGVLFADPKHSDVDVVQAVGRALRKTTTKRSGMVLLPVCYDPTLDEDTTLSTSSFAAVWRVVRGLRRLDSVLDADLTQFRRTPSRRGRPDGSRQLTKISFEIPSAPDLATLVARLVDATSPAWDAFYAALEDYTAEHGTSRPPAGHRLHAWCERQRRAHRAGMLLPDRASALKSIPGWVWDLDEQKWLEQWAHVAGVISAGLDLSDPDLMDQPVPHPNPRTCVTTVGRWCAHQRILARRGDLDPRQRRLLEEVPAWTWSALSPSDQACADLLGEYVAWKGDANVPADYVDDDQSVGRWLIRVRRRRALGTLDQALLDELGVLTPPPSNAGALRWHRGDSCWAAGAAALRQYARREGGCRPPEGHVEHLPEGDVRLQTWTRLQRHEHRYGRLSAARVAALEAIPGWRWEVQPAPRVRLDIGDARHGTRTGYVKGCRCVPCTDANRSNVTTGTEVLVPASRARGHLRVLEGQGASQKSIARAANLNTKTVAQILAGDRDRIHPATERAVLTLTMSDIRAAATPGTVIPSGPTWQLLDDLLERGWPKMWLAREISGGPAPLQLHRTGLIQAGTAAKIAALHAKVDTLTPPPRPRGRPYPSLAEILADVAEPA